MNKLSYHILILLTLVVSMPVSAAITHRYDFVTDANDVVGGLETVLESGAVVQDGALVLAGGSPGPRAVLDGPGIGINGYTGGVSIEAWFTMDAAVNNTRIFDFGDTSGVDGGWYWFYTPKAGNTTNCRLAIGTGGFPGWRNGEEGITAPMPATATKIHLVCTFDTSLQEMRIYQDGELAASGNVTSLLTDVHNNFAYLGSAVYPGDPEFQGTIDEFRIYDKALSLAEVRLTGHFGPDDAKEIALRSISPADGDDQVDASAIVTLSWIPEAWVDEFATYNVYVGTDPNLADPNIADVTAYANVVQSTGIDGLSYPIAAETLAYGTPHYWRVDTVQEDTTKYQGVGMSFITLPDAPYFIDPVPAVVVSDENGNVSVTVNAGNTDTYAWYREGDTPGSAGTTDTLTLTEVTEAEAGNYYCDISFENGPVVTSDPIKVVARQLIAHWTFDNDLIDDTGNGWDGTTMSTVTSAAKDPNFASGRVGQAIDLDGTETYVDLPDGLQDDLRSGLTWSVWAYPRTAANWARFLSFNNGAASDNIFFSRIGTGTTLRFNVNRGATGSSLDAANAMELNVWQMFTVTMSPTGEAALYKNGVQLSTGTVQMPNVLARTNSWIGRSAWPDALYNGLLDDIRIYNHALSQEEVALLYTTTTPEEDYICFEGPLEYDLNNDCRVNLTDVAVLAQWWLECQRVPTSACGW